MWTYTHFLGLLYGPDLPETGTIVSGEWDDQVLSLYGQERYFHTNSASLNVEPASSNMEHLRVTWPTINGEYMFLLEHQNYIKLFFETGPATLGTHFKNAYLKKRRFSYKLISEVSFYGALILIPLMLLGFLLIYSDVIFD